MDTYDERVQLKWSTLKPSIRKHWQKLTDEDLKHLNGSAEELVNVLRKRYGYGKAQAEIEINRWLNEQDIKSAQ